MGAVRSRLVIPVAWASMLRSPTGQSLPPPSGAGLTNAPSLCVKGVISAATIHKVAKLREHGVKFVVITGARLSTLLMRLPYLPAGDAFVCENGGQVLE